MPRGSICVLHPPGSVTIVHSCNSPEMVKTLPSSNTLMMPSDVRPTPLPTNFRKNNFSRRTAPPICGYRVRDYWLMCKLPSGGRGSGSGCETTMSTCYVRLWNDYCSSCDLRKAPAPKLTVSLSASKEDRSCKSLVILVPDLRKISVTTLNRIYYSWSL